MPNEQFFSYIMTTIYWNDDVFFLLDQQAELDFNSASLLK
jgi:hypothetical protein